MIAAEMLSVIKVFDKYIVADEIGDWIGVREDAPKEAKIAFDEFMKAQKNAHRGGVKI